MSLKKYTIPAKELTGEYVSLTVHKKDLSKVVNAYKEKCNENVKLIRESGKKDYLFKKSLDAIGVLKKEIKTLKADTNYHDVTIVEGGNPMDEIELYNKEFSVLLLDWTPEEFDEMNALWNKCYNAQ